MAKEGSNRGWVRNLRSGSVAQFLNTMTLCFVFFGMVCNRVNLCYNQYMFSINGRKSTSLNFFMNPNRV